MFGSERGPGGVYAGKGDDLSREREKKMTFQVKNRVTKGGEKKQMKG